MPWTKTTRRPRTLSATDVAHLAVGIVASVALAAAISINALLPSPAFPRSA